jgi:transposase
MINKLYTTKMSPSLNKQYEIVFLHEYPEGPKWRYAKIASYIHCSKSTVIYWIQKYQENKDLTDEKRSGRPHKTTKAQDKQIEKMAARKHNIISTEIKKINLKKKV